MIFFTFQIFTRSPWLMPTGKLVEPRITQFLICFFAKIPSTANSPFLPGCQNASISSKTLGIKIWKSNLFWIMHPTTKLVGYIIQKRSTYCISSIISGIPRVILNIWDRHCLPMLRKIFFSIWEIWLLKILKSTHYTKAALLFQGK